MSTKFRIGLVLLTITLISIAAHAAPPDTDLWLPYFETGGDLSSQSTLFSINNPSNALIDVTATVYTNWAIPVLTVPIHLAAHATQPVNLRDWLVYGALPARQRVCADSTAHCAELSVLKAQLMGQPSPSDRLYYASATEGSLLTGFVIFHATAPVFG